ncbi:hypothetical protein DNTS_031686 [Danionella cerebrum]|uniref:Uncharacterized protein n=1 Tax=Danionella cerebrum TaxID=2873325 RepID=A0A553R581_9TELE|nr:hypothetical protein DNTS_031686 [Danionella translucida]
MTILREKVLLPVCDLWKQELSIRKPPQSSQNKVSGFVSVARGALALHLNLWSPAPNPSSPSHPWSLEWCAWSPGDPHRESPKLDPSPQMTGSNSMSSGYCSLDEESDDFTFFTAKTSFFRRPQAKQAPKVEYEHRVVRLYSLSERFSI